MNHASHASSEKSSRAMVAVGQMGWSNAAAVLLSAVLAISVIAVGLRLAIDAELLTSRFNAEGLFVRGVTVRCFGVALVAAGQSIAVAGVVWRLHRRRRIDRWLVQAALLAGFLAAFAGVVLVMAGRPS